MGFRVQIWSGGALWNPLSFLIKDSIQSNLWTGKESSLLKIQLVKNNLCLENMRMQMEKPILLIFTVNVIYLKDNRGNEPVNIY